MSNIRWAFNVSKWNPTKKDILLATRCIQLEEKERLGKFFFQNDFKSSLIGRLMMRKYVADVTDIPYDKIKFLRDGHGKPYIPDGRYQNVKFNVSHQGEFVVCGAFKSDESIGIDTMNVKLNEGKNLCEFFRLMRKQFSSHEWDTIKNGGTELEQVALFYRHWCLKESYVKAIGVGITVDLRDISFKINSPLSSNIVDDTELYVKGAKQDWEFHECLLDERHCVAVALSSRNNEKIAFMQLDFDELLANCVPILDEDLKYCNDFFAKSVKKY